MQIDRLIHRLVCQLEAVRHGADIRPALLTASHIHQGWIDQIRTLIIRHEDFGKLIPRFVRIQIAGILPDSKESIKYKTTLRTHQDLEQQVKGFPYWDRKTEEVPALILERALNLRALCQVLGIDADKNLDVAKIAMVEALGQEQPQEIPEVGTASFYYRVIENIRRNLILCRMLGRTTIMLDFAGLKVLEHLSPLMFHRSSAMDREAIDKFLEVTENYQELSSLDSGRSACATAEMYSKLYPVCKALEQRSIAAQKTALVLIEHTSLEVREHAAEYYLSKPRAFSVRDMKHMLHAVGQLGTTVGTYIENKWVEIRAADVKDILKRTENLSDRALLQTIIDLIMYRSSQLTELPESKFLEVAEIFYTHMERHLLEPYT